ncbi:MAG: helix-turn-helix domain-containing protein [Pseudomonadota bacterium]|nr:helix-turn-helix domain-containing protein [Pseudomonadota bacterium]
MDNLLELAQSIADKRQELGISREQLAAKTRVPLAFIITFEEGRHDELPDSAYSNGFVRIICKQLGIPAPALAATKIQLQTRIATDIFHGRRRKSLALPNKRHTYRMLSALMFLLPIVAGILILVFGGQSWFTNNKQAITTAQTAPHSPIVESAAVDQPNASRTAATAATTDDIAPPLTPTSEQQVRLMVHYPTEVKIKLDGTQQTQTTLLPREYVFNFKEESEFTILDTNAMTVSFNGEVITNIERFGKHRTLVFRTTESNDANY